MMNLNFLKIVVVLSITTLFMGCSMAQSEQTKTETLTDANIAAIVVGANNIDISAGNIALKRSNNEQVKKFAERMIVDHKSVLASAVELVTKLGVTPINNELVSTFTKQAKKNETNLNSLTGSDFDKAYIAHEVAYHQAVINVIETQLIPGAQNAELKSLLISVLPAFKAHLQHCEMIQKSLS